MRILIKAKYTMTLLSSAASIWFANWGSWV